MAILPKTIYMFSTIPIKNLMTFITDSTLKYISKHKRRQIAKTILTKTRNAGGISILKFKLYYRAIALKTAWCWHKNRYEGQCNKTEDVNMNSHNYTHIIF
jgi:hypothetical protein